MFAATEAERCRAVIGVGANAHRGASRARRVPRVQRREQRVGVELPNNEVEPEVPQGVREDCELSQYVLVLGRQTRVHEIVAYQDDLEHSDRPGRSGYA